MKSYLLLGLIMAVSSLPAFSQGRDTVFAVQKLFRQKRGSATGLLAAADSAISPTKYIQLDARRAATVEKKPDALGASAFFIAGAIKATRYSAENEAYILRNYSLGGSIPPAIRHKLKRKHFHRTARDVRNASH